MTENKAHDIDLFNKQAILKGERVPVIMGWQISNIMNETDNRAWFGKIPYTESTFIPLTKGAEQAKTLPWLTRYQNCEQGVDLCSAYTMVNKFDSVCWIDRTDLAEPQVFLDNGKMQTRIPSGQASWHPGWRGHRIESRKSAILFLKAFNKAFDIWEDGIKADGFPLDKKYWHVGEYYKKTQDTLLEHINGVGKGTSPCEQYYEQYGFDKWCRTVMHGMSEFRPISLGDGNNIASHIKASPNGYIPEYRSEVSYHGPDLYPTSWKIPEGDVDVHAIAIATNYEASQSEHLWGDLNDDDEEELDASRRGLRERAIKGTKKMKLDATSTPTEVSRSLGDDNIVPGEGWGMFSDTSSKGDLCDGSPMSECHRSHESCLMYGNNDLHSGIAGDGLSGWLVINIPPIKSGIIWAKMEVSIFFKCLLYPIYFASMLIFIVCVNHSGGYLAITGI